MAEHEEDIPKSRLEKIADVLRSYFLIVRGGPRTLQGHMVSAPQNRDIEQEEREKRRRERNRPPEERERDLAP